MEAILHNTGVWVAVSFVIFAYGFAKFGVPGFMKMLDARIEQVQREIATAQTLRHEAQELLAQYQQKQHDAQKEADRIVENARSQATAIAKQAETDLTENMARREVMLKERLKRMEETAVDEIRRYAAELAVKATTQIIVERMDQATAQRLVDDSIKKVGGSLN